MIARLQGTIIEREERAVIVDVQGIGYRVAVLSKIREKLRPGATVTFHIYHDIGEDREVLYGFDSRENLKYFELLLTVPSVGPRTAMNILDMASPAHLEQAVAEDDVTLLTKVSGVGKKTAERIIVELKTKIKAPRVRSVPGTLQHETIEALVSIGYSPAQARIAVAKIPKGVTTVEEAVRAALRTKSK